MGSAHPVFRLISLSEKGTRQEKIPLINFPFYWDTVNAKRKHWSDCIGVQTLVSAHKCLELPFPWAWFTLYHARIKCASLSA